MEAIAEQKTRKVSSENGNGEQRNFETKLVESKLGIAAGVKIVDGKIKYNDSDVVVDISSSHVKREEMIFPAIMNASGMILNRFEFDKKMKGNFSDGRQIENRPDAALYKDGSFYPFEWKHINTRLCNIAKNKVNQLLSEAKKQARRSFTNALLSSTEANDKYYHVKNYLKMPISIGISTDELLYKNNHLNIKKYMVSPFTKKPNPLKNLKKFNHHIETYLIELQIPLEKVNDNLDSDGVLLEGAVKMKYMSNQFLRSFTLEAFEEFDEQTGNFIVGKRCHIKDLIGLIGPDGSFLFGVSNARSLIPVNVLSRYNEMLKVIELMTYEIKTEKSFEEALGNPFIETLESDSENLNTFWYRKDNKIIYFSSSATISNGQHRIDNLYIVTYLIDEYINSIYGKQTHKPMKISIMDKQYKIEMDNFRKYVKKHLKDLDRETLKMKIDKWLGTKSHMMCSHLNAEKSKLHRANVCSNDIKPAAKNDMVLAHYKDEQDVLSAFFWDKVDSNTTPIIFEPSFDSISMLEMEKSYRLAAATVFHYLFGNPSYWHADYDWDNRKMTFRSADISEYANINIKAADKVKGSCFATREPEDTKKLQELIKSKEEFLMDDSISDWLKESIENEIKKYKQIVEQATEPLVLTLEAKKDLEVFIFVLNSTKHSSEDDFKQMKNQTIKKDKKMTGAEINKLYRFLGFAINLLKLTIRPNSEIWGNEEMMAKALSKCLDVIEIAQSIYICNDEKPSIVDLAKSPIYSIDHLGKIKEDIEPIEKPKIFSDLSKELDGLLQQIV